MYAEETPNILSDQHPVSGTWSPKRKVDPN